MTDSIKKEINRVNTLSSSLDELEKKLEPLLSQPLSDSLNSLETLQRAKLQVLLPYLINDLIFIYLKTRGIDPKTHPVVAELDRVKQYFGKIKDAEESDKKRTTEVDKAAAGRFIKHAISEAQRSLPNAEPVAANGAAPSESRPPSSVPVRITDKMREREAYLREVAEQSGSEEGANLEVFGEVEAGDSPADGVPEGKGKGIERPAHEKTVPMTSAVEVTSEASKRKKRKRPMDPFGRGSLAEGEDSSPVPGATDKQPKKKNKNKKMGAALLNTHDVSTDSRVGSDADSSRRGPVSKRKKNKGKGQLPTEESRS